MAEKSNIEWTDATYNPWQGCHKVDPEDECKNCYMYRDKKRYGQDPTIVVRSSDKIFCAPLKWQDPRKIFVCSWSDFFIEEADPWRLQAIEVMTTAPQHTYIIVTKRPERAIECLYGSETSVGILGGGDYFSNWWLLVTAGTQKSADKRIPEILKLRDIAPWPVIGVSIEPVLGPVSLRWMPVLGDGALNPRPSTTDHLDGLRKLDWVICGGESGPKARPVHPDWVRSVRDQCVEAGVPFFFKQWGEWCPDDFETVTETGRTPKRCWVHRGTGEVFDYAYPYNAEGMMWQSKKTAGRMLDGRIWNEYPQ